MWASIIDMWALTCPRTRGHRTRNGTNWSRDAVLTVLRNRVYIGEVYFREHHYTAPHTKLVAPDLFWRLKRS